MSSDDSREVPQAVRSLIGASIERVLYTIPIGSEVDLSSQSDEMHEASMGVELHVAHHIVVLKWRMEGYCEELEVDSSDLEELERSAWVEAIDVTTAPPWADRLHSPIRNVGLSFHLSDDRCDETIWSVRINFENGLSAVVALGEESYSGDLTYIPDNLVVLFDSSLSRSYRIPAASESAWGTDLTTPG